MQMTDADKLDIVMMSQMKQWYNVTTTMEGHSDTE